MSSVSQAPLSGRYLSFLEREEIALSRASGSGVRAIARRLHRAPSTISRELRRNAATRGGNRDYRALTAQWHADRCAGRPKSAKLAIHDALRHYVQDRLDSQGPCRSLMGRISPAQTYAGSVGVMDDARIVAGQHRGVPSKSPTGSNSISR